MIPYKINCESEFLLLIDSGNFNSTFINTNKDNISKIFNFIYVINIFKNRVETKRYYDESFNMTFSLLLESSYALLTGQCRASLLLLRSALEDNIKFVLEQERKQIKITDPEVKFQKLDFRFADTKNKFVNDISNSVSKTDFQEYYCGLERSLTYYKKLCGIVHSNSKEIPVSIANYYDNLYTDTLLEKEDFFKLYINSLTQIFTLLYFMMRNSLYNWDSYELKAILNLLFGDKKSNRYIKIIKGS